MVKCRLRDAGLPGVISPHSFRVATITDLLEQGVPLEDVQRLAGHADPRTTRLYDRRQKKMWLRAGFLAGVLVDGIEARRGEACKLRDSYSAHGVHQTYLLAPSLTHLPQSLAALLSIHPRSRSSQDLQQPHHGQRVLLAVSQQVVSIFPSLVASRLSANHLFPGKAG